MKKFKFLSALFALVLVLAACGDDTDGGETGTDKKEEVTYENGFYYASSETDENGWVDFIEIEIIDEEVNTINFDSYNMFDGDPRTKSERSEDGDYVLAGEGADYHEQVLAIEAYILDGEDISEVEFDDEGKSDAISSATISYESVAELFAMALDYGPVTFDGDLEDGYYFGQAETDDKGNTAQVVYVVYNGEIVLANFDAAVPGDDGVSYKSALAMSGEYELSDDAMASMDEQLVVLNEELIANQTFEYEYDDEGKTDAISGATITVDVYQEAFDNAAKLD